MTTFPFRFSRLYRVLAAPFGISPSTTGIEVAEGRLTARFGPWVVTTTVDNITAINETGPYKVLKTAGPAHLSLVDRGLTMATNRDGGVCLRFETPVRGLDPFGWLRHPGLTVTVDDVEGFRRALEDKDDSDDARSIDTGIPALSPRQAVGGLAKQPVGMFLAAVRYVRTAGAVRRSVSIRALPAPEPEDLDRVDGLQRIDKGVGPAYQRAYRITIVGTNMTPEQLLDRIASDFNAVTPADIAEFVPTEPETAPGAPGQEYCIRMPGPWDARVRVLDRTPTSIRLATLKGHMEAGEIEFSTGRAEHLASRGTTTPLLFEIRSVARSGDRGFHLLYRTFSIGMRMQEYMWVHVCARAAVVAGGRRQGPIKVETIEYAG